MTAAARAADSSAAVRPAAGEFARLAQGYAVVPVWRDLPVDPVPEPVAVFAAVGGAVGSTLLENLALGGDRRGAVIGLDPATTLLVHNGQVSWTHGPVCPVPAGGSLAETLRAVAERLVAPVLPDAPPLSGGAIGVLGGDAARPPAGHGPEQVGGHGHGPEHRRGPAPEPGAPPDSALTFPRTIIIVDPGSRRLRLVAPVLVSPEEGAQRQYAAAVDRLAEVAARLDQVPPLPALQALPALAGSGSPAPVRSGDDPFGGNLRGSDLRGTDLRDTDLPDPEYQALIEAALRRVRAGELRQVTISRRYTAPTRADPVTVYRALLAGNPSPYPYLLRLPGVDLVGASPQGLLRVCGGEIASYVIAGTRPRGADPAADAALAAELVADAKERDEHEMLVALAREDLAPVARPGTVRVTESRRLVRYARVMHLTTEIAAELAAGPSPAAAALAALWSVFPAGTVAGTPRAVALRVIEELEPRPRGLYGGAVGYLDFAGNLDWCLGIRALQLRDGIATTQAGAGVVAGSEPALEVAESRAKASGVFAALAAAGRAGEVGAVRWER